MTESAIIERSYRRITKVQAAGWLSRVDMAYYCGMSPAKMDEFIRMPDFPKPSCPDGSFRRWKKAEVDNWLLAHRIKADPQ